MHKGSEDSRSNTPPQTITLNYSPPPEEAKNIMQTNRQTFNQSVDSFMI
jgi:hypothetical protein